MAVDCDVQVWVDHLRCHRSQDLRTGIAHTVQVGVIGQFGHHQVARACHRVTAHLGGLDFEGRILAQFKLGLVT